MKIFKNKIIITVICLLLAGGLMFAYSKLFVSKNETINVVTVKQDVKRGTVLTDEMLVVKEVGSFGLAKNVVTDMAKAKDLYAITDLLEGDLILDSKVAKEMPAGTAKLLQLTGEKVAVSVSVKSFANGVSDKLLPGDIVSCIITQEDYTEIPSELNYLEVVTTTYQNGFDKTDGENNEQNVATVTVLATPRQALVLGSHEQLSAIHMALVYRGDKVTADEFLKKQDDIMKTLPIKTSVGLINAGNDQPAPVDQGGIIPLEDKDEKKEDKANGTNNSGDRK